MCVDKNSWKVRSQFKSFGVGVVKIGCGHSGNMTLKLAVTQGGIAFVNSQKLKVTFKVNFWLKIDKNGCSHFGLETLKLAVSQESV